MNTLINQVAFLICQLQQLLLQCDGHDSIQPVLHRNDDDAVRFCPSDLQSSRLLCLGLLCQNQTVLLVPVIVDDIVHHISYKVDFQLPDRHSLARTSHQSCSRGPLWIEPIYTATQYSRFT